MKARDAYLQALQGFGRALQAHAESEAVKMRYLHELFWKRCAERGYENGFYWEN